MRERLQILKSIVDVFMNRTVATHIPNIHTHDIEINIAPIALKIIEDDHRIKFCFLPILIKLEKSICNIDGQFHTLKRQHKDIVNLFHENLVFLFSVEVITYIVCYIFMFRRKQERK